MILYDFRKKKKQGKFEIIIAWNDGMSGNP